MGSRAKFQWSHDSSDSVREEDEDSEILSEISVTSNNSLITNKSGINILVGSATEDIRDIKDDDILPKTKTKRYLRHRYTLMKITGE